MNPSALAAASGPAPEQSSSDPRDVSPPKKGAHWSARADGETTSITLKGDWIARTDGVVEGIGERNLGPGVRTIRFDATGLGRWDSALIAFLLSIRDTAKQRDIAFETDGLPASAQRLLALVAPPGPVPRQAPRTPLLERTGLWAMSVAAETGETSALVGNIILRGAMAFRGRAAMRGRDLIDTMYGAGATALPLVAVVNVLMGGILAFIGVTELQALGAGVYVADLVAIGMVREMAPLMTAIIMCGRTGAAFAANIAAMQGAEEIDALRAVGIPVFDYLILPRVVALTAMMPLLYVFGCVVGIIGGLIVGAMTLGVPVTSFLVMAQQSLTLGFLGIGLFKSVAFGAVIAIVALRVGLRAGRNAAAVGNAATSAVVAGIVGVIALDAVIDLCANVLGI
jgi:phospholipid/cholesterol/gamma-HCH transport system permease protein